MANPFAWSLGCGCGCGESCPSCLHCSAGGRLGSAGTLTDANGTIPIVWDGSGWVGCYMAPATVVVSIPGEVCSEEEGETPVTYRVQCPTLGTDPPGEVVVVERSWIETQCDIEPFAFGYSGNATCTDDGGPLDIPGGFETIAASTTDCEGLSTTTGSGWDTTPGPNGTTSPVSGPVTVWIPNIPEDMVCCGVCDLPAEDLTLSWTNSIIGNGSGTFVFDGVSSWTYAATGTGSGSSGPLYASSCVDGGGGVFAWTNPGNARTVNAVYATAITNNEQTTNYLHWTDFGFAIPSGATIKGIKAEVARFASGGGAVDFDVRLLKAGSRTATNLTGSASIPTTLTAATYGGPTALWGTTWTPAQINASNFGLAWQANNSGLTPLTVSVDWGRLTVYFEFEGWTAVLSCSGGTMTLAVTYGLATGTVTRTSTACDPLDLVWTASGDLATAGFGTFTVTP